ncbi:hypothetical protein EC960932_0550, partial [Escherichia coli 96.0932]
MFRLMIGPVSKTGVGATLPGG